MLEETLGATTPVWTVVAARSRAGATVASAGALAAMAGVPAAVLESGATRSDAVVTDGQAALAVAGGRSWALMAVRPDGSITLLGSYEPRSLGDDLAFRGEGDFRGAAEVSAMAMREFVIGGDR